MDVMPTHTNESRQVIGSQAQKSLCARVSLNAAPRQYKQAAVVKGKVTAHDIPLALSYDGVSRHYRPTTHVGDHRILSVSSIIPGLGCNAVVPHDQDDHINHQANKAHGQEHGMARLCWQHKLAVKKQATCCMNLCCAGTRRVQHVV